jgi:quinol monooxygenase YgiN
MIAQLTHLRPRPGQLEAVLALLREWGEATRDDPRRPSYAFLCQDDDHLFLVSLHADQAAYEAGARASQAWLARLMPLLIDHHGPTYYGPVLAQAGSATGTGVLPSAIRIGSRHGD